MRTIIAGSRTFNDYKKMKSCMKQIDWIPSIILSGTARGADRLGEKWAKENGISIEKYPAEWDKYGRRAGYVRNSAMAQNAEALVAFWDGRSRGTKHMITLAKKKGLKMAIFGD